MQLTYRGARYQTQKLAEKATTIIECENVCRGVRPSSKAAVGTSSPNVSQQMTYRGATYMIYSSCRVA